MPAIRPAAGIGRTVSGNSYVAITAPAARQRPIMLHNPAISATRFAQYRSTEQSADVGKNSLTQRFPPKTFRRPVG